MAAQTPPQPGTLHPNYPAHTGASQRGEPSLTPGTHLAAERSLMHLNITGDRLTGEFREGTESPPGARGKDFNDCLRPDQYSENVGGRKKNVSKTQSTCCSQH